MAPAPRVPKAAKVKAETVEAAPGVMITSPAPADGVSTPTVSLLPSANARYSRIPPANCVPRMGSSMNWTPEESLMTSAAVEVGRNTSRPLEIWVSPA